MLIICPVLSADGQDETGEAAGNNWQLSLSGLLSGTQTSFSNWKEGGVNTLGYFAELRGEAIRSSQTWKQTHNMRLAFGQIKQDELEFRKSTDIIQYGFVLQHTGESLLNPTVAVEFRTQFASGFDYKKNPLKDGREPPVEVSGFLAPAYFTQSLGLSYDPDTWFLTRLGVGGKQTIVNILQLGTLYGLDPGKRVRYELGLESQTGVKIEIVKNATWESKLGLFAAFNKPELPDALWENFLTMKVNSWLNVRMELVSLYDSDISTRVQYKRITSIGVNITIL